MKNLFKISFISCICIFLSSCNIQKNNFISQIDEISYNTQANMLNSSHNKVDKIIKKYNKICDNLAKNFYKDKSFVQALRKNQALYLQYQTSESDMVLPKENTEYGSNYGIYSDNIILNSTENQIRNLKNLVELYCLYNEFYNYENACNAQTIDAIFK